MDPTRITAEFLQPGDSVLTQGGTHPEHLDSEVDTAQGWNLYQASAQTLAGFFSPEAEEIVQALKCL